MSIYRENSTLFMNKEERENSVNEADYGIIPGYTSSIDFLKMIEESYQNDMAIFESVYAYDMLELVLEAEENNSGADNKEAKEKHSKSKLASFREAIEKLIDAITTKWASILDSINKKFAEIYKNMNDKFFKENKAKFLDSVNVANLKKNYTKDKEFYLITDTFINKAYTQLDNGFKAITSDNIDELARKYLENSSIENLEDNIKEKYFEKDLITTDKGLSIRDTLMGKEKGNPFTEWLDCKEIVNIIEDYSYVSSIHKLKNDIIISLRKLKNSYKLKYKDESDDKILNASLKVIGKIQEFFSKNLNAVISAQKVLLTQSYSLFKSGVTFIGATNKKDAKDQKNKKDGTVETEEIKPSDSDKDFSTDGAIDGEYREVQEEAGMFRDITDMTLEELEIHEQINNV